MLRCPTCLSLLNGGEARCPACRTRLRKRSRPIVLGESARITSNPHLQLDREPREVTEATHAEARRRRRIAEAMHRSTADPRPVSTGAPEPAEFVAELVWAPDPVPAAEHHVHDVRAEPQPEVMAILSHEDDIVPAPDLKSSVVPNPSVEPPPAFPALLFGKAFPEPEPESAREPESRPPPKPRYGLFDLTWDDERAPEHEAYRPGPTRSQRFIDLTSEAEHGLDVERQDSGHAPEDMQEMFEELHRKARAGDAPDHDDADASSPRALDDYGTPSTSRALRLTAARANRRRRWNVEFRGHRAGSDDT